MKSKNIIKKIIRFVLTCGKPEIKVYPQITCIGKNDLLKGRTALITGGTSGIGFEIARCFINAGCTVVITSRSQKRADEACVKLNEAVAFKNRVFGVEMDNLDVKNMELKISQILDMVPSKEIDILVNNAGINGGHFSNAVESTYDKILDTNLKGPFFITQAISRYMVKNKIEGNILNIASSSSLRPADSAYCLSKWRIRGFTEGVARSLAPYNIVVNGLAPGPTATPMLLEDDKNDYSWPANLTRRMVMPEEIANMAVVLVSNMSRMIIGDIVYMTGGGGVVTNEDVNYYFDIE